MSYLAANYFVTGESPRPNGEQVSDDHLVLGVSDQRRLRYHWGDLREVWQNLCHAFECQQLLADERFERNADSVTNRDALERMLTGEFETYETDEIVTILEKADVLARAIHDIDAVFRTRRGGTRDAYQRNPLDAGEIDVPEVAYTSRSRR